MPTDSQAEALRILFFYHLYSTAISQFMHIFSYSFSFIYIYITYIHFCLFFWPFLVAFR